MKSLLIFCFVVVGIAATVVGIMAFSFWNGYYVGQFRQAKNPANRPEPPGTMVAIAKKITPPEWLPELYEEIPAKPTVVAGDQTDHDLTEKMQQLSEKLDKLNTSPTGPAAPTPPSEDAVIPEIFRTPLPR